MKISIVIPNYNYGEYIKRAIDSVLQQDYSDKEVIIVDGSSNDNTVEILKSYGSLIKWISETDRGQWEAINKGLGMAQGEIFAYLNSDDWYEKGIFKDVVNVFKEHPEVNFVYGDCRIIDGKSEKIFSPPEKINFNILLKSGNLTPQPATFFRKSVLSQAGGTGEYHYMMEYDMNLKALKHGKAFYLKKPLATFFMHQDQKSDVKDSKLIIMEMFRISRSHGGPLFSRVFFSYLKNLYDNLVRMIKGYYFLRVIKSWFYLAFWLLSQKKDMPTPSIIKHLIIKKQAKDSSTKVFIETGTYFGDTVEAVKSLFLEIHSIELGKELAALAQKRFAKYPQIYIHQGDSAVILPGLLENIKKSCLFWLDAHYSEGVTVGDDEHLPLISEIKTILGHWVFGSVILIDDARLMGRQKGYPSFEEIQKIVQDSGLGLKIEQNLDIIRIHG